MLLVNNSVVGGATPAQFVHAPWGRRGEARGPRVSWFLFCVGVAIPYSVASSPDKVRTLLHALGARRFWRGLGCLLQSAIEDRLYFAIGVLGLIGLSYLVGSLLYGLPALFRALAAAAMLVAYGLALRHLPFGGGPPEFSEGRHLVRHLNETYLAAYSLRGLPRSSRRGSGPHRYPLRRSLAVTPHDP